MTFLDRRDEIDPVGEECGDQLPEWHDLVFDVGDACPFKGSLVDLHFKPFSLLCVGIE
jgi:hypothetical protein